MLSYLKKHERHRQVIRWCNAVMKERRGPVFVKALNEAREALLPRRKEV